MDAADLAFAGPSRQAEMVRAGEVSAKELTELYLERIERIDSEVNAYRTVMAERALAEAKQADQRRKAGEDRPLLGVPLAVKDNVDVAGELTTHGTAAHERTPAAADAELVRRLRGAGAVIIGKTNMPELAIIGDTESPTFGVTRNPWDPDRSAGGSSGGSGAAVAAGLASAAHATDGAGSIRIPAANCGLFGLKPQRGRVSLMPDARHWHGLSVAGALTRSVRDSALLLDVMSGPAAGDEHEARPSERPFADAADQPPGRLRVAVSTFPFAPTRLHPEVRQALDETAELLRSLGHAVAKADPAYNELGANFMPRFLKGMQEEGEAMPRPERLSRRTRGFARLGRAIHPAALRVALRDEARQTSRILRLYDDHDVLLTPVTARPPVRAGQWEGLGALRTLASMSFTYPFTAPWNVTGQPAASVPAGFTRHGLPLAVQLIGRPHDEATLYSLAGQIEVERPWADRRPSLA
ncbi:MAG: amidase [Thermoleophilaceae bacterium]|nr:amidase [Thermoleophilaceae bacterium]